jgi:hypothetical protein
MIHSTAIIGSSNAQCVRAGIHTNVLSATLLLASLLTFANALSQDLEPRAYTNAPIGLNFLIAGYGNTQGGVVVDPSIPLENANIEVNAGLLAYARSFGIAGRSAKFDVAAPYASLTGSADFLQSRYVREVDGFGDPRLRFSINLHGAPALSMREIAAYRPDLIIGASLSVWAPLGQYDPDRLINIGTNRWALKPELGLSQALGRWTFETVGAIAFYADNDRFFGGHRRTQHPVSSIQGGMTRSFGSGTWVALFGTYYTGGRANVDGVRGRNLQSNSRVGVTLSLPVSRHNSIKLYANTGVSIRTGSDFDGFGIAWQYRWESS